MSRAKHLIWSILCIAVLVVLFTPLPEPAAASQERLFRIEASQYAYSPAEISVNPGDRVAIELVSTDVVHGIFIDGYGLSVQADPGQTARLEFTADREGSFRMRCNVTCGAMHPFMIGKIHVGRNTLLWRALALTGILAAGALAAVHTRRLSNP